jgi:hypothetical protein
MPINLSANGPTEIEFKRLRLGLSVFQDGSGWERKIAQDGSQLTFPGYRQFERVVADVFGGLAPQNKGIFDVLIPLPDGQSWFGISCKMKGSLREATGKNQRVYIEMSNASGRFLDEVKNKVGVDFREKPLETGHVLLSIVQGWYDLASLSYVKSISLRESSHLVLLYDKEQNYTLYQFPLTLPDASQLVWSFRPHRHAEIESRSLVATSNGSILLEWYLSSGGQLKYYPPVTQATWKSPLFRLEPLPTEVSTNMVERAKVYFPDLW